MRKDIDSFNQFPAIWSKSILEKIATKITKGSTPTTYGFAFLESGINFIKVENVSNNSVDIKSIKDFISEEAHTYQKKSRLEENDILFSIAGTIGNSCIIKKEHLPANTNQALAIFGGFSNVVVPKFLQLQLTSFITDNTKSKARGGAMNNISLGDLKQLEIIIPPLLEQKQIVSKIEELFSDLDNGIENLKKAQEHLKTYRQAVLKYAFEGKLTEQWRNQQVKAGNPLETAEKLLERIKKEREKHYQQQIVDWKKACEQAEVEGKKKPAKPKKPTELPPLTEKELVKLPNLPKPWYWAKFGEACEKIFDGTHFSPPNFPNGDYKYITAKNIKENMIDLKDISFVSKDDHKEIYSRADVKKNDVLYIKDGAKTGIAAVNSLEEEFSLLSSVGVFRTNQNFIYPKYLCHFLNSPVTRKRMLSNIAGVAITRLTLVKLNNSLFALAPLNEQFQIIQEIESRLSVCDKLEQIIQDSLKKSEALRQSILKKAFSGDLTRTWRENHPELISGENSAQKLLERIKAEKAKAESEMKNTRSTRANKEKSWL